MSRDRPCFACKKVPVSIPSIFNCKVLRWPVVQKSINRDVRESLPAWVDSSDLDRPIA